jgi:hypothetical protein
MIIITPPTRIRFFLMDTKNNTQIEVVSVIFQDAFPITALTTSNNTTN